MSQTDAVIAGFALISAFAVVVIGGLFYPNTLAGAVARFVFSVS